MKLGLRLAVSLLAASGLFQAAQAALISHAPVDGLATFQDTSTGLVWLQLPDLFGLDYATQVSTAASAGFTVADFATVNQLGTGSASLGNGTTDWDAVEAIIGGSTARQLMWGNYSIPTGPGSPNGWYYAYRIDTSWLYYPPFDTSGQSDLGLFAYESGTVTAPEPAGFAVLGVGLLGVAGLRRARTLIG